jgi:hypothetical protein
MTWGHPITEKNGFQVDLASRRGQEERGCKNKLKRKKISKSASAVLSEVFLIIPAVNSRVRECREGVGTPPLGPAWSRPGLKAEVSLASMREMAYLRSFLKRSMSAISMRS